MYWQCSLPGKVPTFGQQQTCCDREWCTHFNIRSQDPFAFSILWCEYWRTILPSYHNQHLIFLTKNQRKNQRNLIPKPCGQFAVGSFHTYISADFTTRQKRLLYPVKMSYSIIVISLSTLINTTCHVDTGTALTCQPPTCGQHHAGCKGGPDWPRPGAAAADHPW